MRQIFAIVGPTAAGKTALAIAVAQRIDAEIVSVDSAQIFRGLDIGTAKPSASELAQVPHHLIDVADPNTQWTAATFRDAADAAIADILSRGRRVLLCGGTGLWLRALVRGVFEAPEIDEEIRERIRVALKERGSAVLHQELSMVDPIAAARIHPNDPQRVGRALEVFEQTGEPISTLQAQHGFAETRYALSGVALDVDREVLNERINLRAARMYADGLVDETRARLDEGALPDGPGLSIIGYRDAVAHLRGHMTVEEAQTATAQDTRRYAKRQRNWFRSEQDVRWVRGDTSPEDCAALLTGANAVEAE